MSDLVERLRAVGKDYDFHDNSLIYEAAARIASLETQRDELLAALVRVERKLSAYVGVCTGDKELTNTIIPMARAALAKAKR